MHCFNHAELEAVAICTTCGRAICMSCARPTETAVTCSEACQAQADTLAKQLATSAALTVTAQRFTRVTPHIYLLLACALLVLGLIVASLTQHRVLAETAPALWMLAAFCILLAIALALLGQKLKGRASSASEVEQ